MSASWLLARRNMAANRVRLIVSTGGVALAFSLTLALDAILLGVSNQLTRYIDDSGADVFVAQSGVRNLHMVVSTLPADVVTAVEATDGVAGVTPLLYLTGTVGAEDEDVVAYIIGLPPEAAMGGPAQLAAGRAELGPDETVVDRRAAQRLGVGLGDRVTIFGREFTVAGLSERTSNLVNSIAFVRAEDFGIGRPRTPSVSYVLVRVAEGTDPQAVASRIEEQVRGTTVLTRSAFAAEERRLVMDMSGDVVATMNGVGFVVGLTVVALTVYVATLSRRREYGVLKALGASNSFLYRVVLGQAALSVALGILTGLAFTLLLSLAVARGGLDLELAIGLDSVVKVSGIGAVVGLLAALLPIRQVAGLDPQAVFRRGGV